MANAAIAWTNLADAGTLTASTETALMLIALLQDPHPSVRWRSTSNTANFTLDLGSNIAISAVALLGLTMGAAGTLRCRVSTSAGGSTSGDRLDTGVLSFGSAYFDYRYGSFVYPLSQNTARYVRFDLEDSAAAYVEAGRLFVGLRTEFTYNLAPGSSRGRIDLSGRKKAVSGQMHVFRRAKARTLDLNLALITEVQRWSIVEEIDRLNGLTDDVLLILDSASDNVPRDSIFGLVTDLTPIQFNSVPDFYSKQYRIEERL